MSLNDLRRGQSATVLAIPEETLRVQLMRFGITVGCKVNCHSKLPFGPVVLRYGGQEIALGRDIACQIEISN